MKTQIQKLAEKRVETGSVIVLAIVLTFVLVFAILACLSLTALFATHYRLQKLAETVALTQANQINDNDRLGFRNKLMMRSRNMIWLAGKNKQKVDQQFPQLADLANQIMEESKESRQILYQHTPSTDTSKAFAEYLRQKQLFITDLPWLKISALRHCALAFGSLKEAGSNVRLEMEGEQIEENDSDSNLVYAQSKIYKGNIEAKLQSPETGSMSFHIGALPPDFNNLRSQAHLIAADRFDLLSGGVEHMYYPRSAVRCEITVEVSCPLIDQKQVMIARGYAVSASGAPDEE